MTVRTKFKIDVYSCEVMVICSSDIRKSINYYCKKHDPDDKGIKYEPDGFFLCPDAQIALYYIFFDATSMSVNTVSHEKSHLVEQILKDRNIKPAGEARAYLEGLIAEKIDTFLNYQSKNLKYK